MTDRLSETHRPAQIPLPDRVLGAQVDLSAQVVHVYRLLAQTRRSEMVTGPTKTVAGARSVALPSVLVDELPGWILDRRIADQGWSGRRESNPRSHFGRSPLTAVYDLYQHQQPRGEPQQ